MVNIPENHESISTRTGHEELSTSKLGNGTIPSTSNGVTQVPVTRYGKKVLSKYIVVDETSIRKTYDDEMSIKRSNVDGLPTKVVDAEEMSVNADVIGKEKKLPTKTVGEEPTARIHAIPTNPANQHGAKLNINPFVMVICVFFVSSLISNDMDINSFVIRSLRDFCIWGMPIYWVAEKQEIRHYVTLKFSQAKSRWGYF